MAVKAVPRNVSSQCEVVSYLHFQLQVISKVALTLDLNNRGQWRATTRREKEDSKVFSDEQFSLAEWSGGIIYW